MARPQIEPSGGRYRFASGRQHGGRGVKHDAATRAREMKIAGRGKVIDRAAVAKVNMTDEAMLAENIEGAVDA